MPIINNLFNENFIYGMKKFLILILAVIFSSATIATAQNVSGTSTKKEVKKETKAGSTTVKKDAKAESTSAKKETEKTKEVHLKKDGTADKRYKENKTEAKTKHLKKDGTADKRYKENKSKK